MPRKQFGEDKTEYCNLSRIDMQIDVRIDVRIDYEGKLSERLNQYHIEYVASEQYFVEKSELS